MWISRTQWFLALVATTLATLVFLSTVESTYRSTIALLGGLGALGLATVNGVDDGRPAVSVFLALVVATGFLAATWWYNAHSYRLPPMPEWLYLFIPVVAVIGGLLGYAIGYGVRERPPLSSITS